jgi:hypothetical protein
MAYTIIRSDGSTLTTIQDGTINTTSSSLGLPGRNFSGYGQTINTNMVRITENFANASPPPNPIRGQLWYNTANSTMHICPADGTTAASAWFTLTSTSMGGGATFANLAVTGNITANNATIANDIVGDTITVRLATVTSNLAANSAAITLAVVGTLDTNILTTTANLSAAPTTSGAMYGDWNVIGNSSGNAMHFSSGNITFGANSVNGIKCDKYMYANGVQFNPSGTYTNVDVFNYLTGSNSVTAFSGNITPNKITTNIISGGGNVEGIWTLAANARFQATFADLAERFEADAIYEPGTVVELGGEKEVTAVKEELSDNVFGVVSTDPAYLMNNGNGNSETHPAIALAGRVPVKVTGVVHKNDRLVSAGNGMARAAVKGEITAFNSIGRSLSSKSDEGIGIVEAIVNVRV